MPRLEGKPGASSAVYLSNLSLQQIPVLVCSKADYLLNFLFPPFTCLQFSHHCCSQYRPPAPSSHQKAHCHGLGDKRNCGQDIATWLVCCTTDFLHCNMAEFLHNPLLALHHGSVLADYLLALIHGYTLARSSTWRPMLFIVMQAALPPKDLAV
jgi:hypothetical protein